jgi:hypothetical protein
MQFRTLTATFVLLASVAIIPAWAQDERHVGGGRDRCGVKSGWDWRYGKSDRLRVIGLTSDQRLICFTEYDPDDANTIGFVSGFSGGDVRLVGIDYRPANGVLYGLGNAGGIYTIDTTNARGTLRSRLNMPLSGSLFGVDFNPVVDRLRIVSDTGQNLRVNVDDGTTVMDGTLTYTVPPATPVVTAAGVTGSAYTNNDADPNTATTLYGIDTNLDQVAIQSPANAGLLVATGKLSVDTTQSIGFDIYSKVRNGATVDVEGFASLTVNGRVGFYSIRLFTGKAISRGNFRSEDVVLDIAIPLNQR